MATALRQNGLWFIIYTADHEPAHVHVYGVGEVRIDIVTLKVLTKGGLSDRDARRALAVVEESRDAFLETWRKYHG